MEAMIFSIIIPVYKNEASLSPLVIALDGICERLGSPLEVVFVIDGSPDNSYQALQTLLPRVGFTSRVIVLSRNFGSFSAIAAGLQAARGSYFAVMAADLQEPPELMEKFFRAMLGGECDLVLGKREGRRDPILSRLTSHLFWFMYRKFVQPQMPRGGVDVFACNSRVRNLLLSLDESNSTLVGLLMWVGFRRQTIPYSRAIRPYGKSAWSFRRRLRYLKDSVFAFSDLPVRALGLLGIAGLFAALFLACLVVVAKLMGKINVPGYAASTIIIIFFGGLNSLGIAVLGEYLWRTFENTKRRPRYIVFDSVDFGPGFVAENEGARLSESKTTDASRRL